MVVSMWTGPPDGSAMATADQSRTTKILDLEARLASSPESPLFLPLAEAYRRDGRLREAEGALRSGLRHHPEHHSARTALGRVLLEQDRPEEARAELETVLAAVPDNLLAGRLLQELTAGGSSPATEEPEAPASAVQEPPATAPEVPGPAAAVSPALEEPSPTDELSSVTLAELYLRQGDWDAAREIFREVAVREPDNRDVAGRLRWLEEKDPSESPPPEGGAGPGAEPVAGSREVRPDPRVAPLKRFLAAAERLRRSHDG
jgi:tetratricopeptide (TPR) repeat protein